MALAYKGISCEMIAVDLLKGEHNADDYKTRNPMGRVPILYDGSKTLTESAAILEYLEEVHPEPSLFPIKDAFTKAKCREIAEIINSGIQPLQNISVQAYVSDDPEKKKEWTTHWITKGLDVLEKTLRPVSGKFCVGDQISLPDFYIVPQVYSAARFGAKPENYPIISQIHENLKVTEAYQKSRPEAYEPK